MVWVPAPPTSPGSMAYTSMLSMQFSSVFNSPFFLLKNCSFFIFGEVVGDQESWRQSTILGPKDIRFHS